MTTDATPRTVDVRRRPDRQGDRTGVPHHLAGRPHPFAVSGPSASVSRKCRTREPRVDGMTDMAVAAPTLRQLVNCRATGHRLAVALARRRLQVLPAAVPLPHHRPAARNAVARRGARHDGARGARAAVRPAARRAHARRRRASCCPRPGSACVADEPAGRRTVRRRRRRRRAGRMARVGRRAAGQLLRARGPDASRTGRARATGRGRHRRAATARLRRPARRQRPAATSGSSTTRRGRPRARRSRARRCSR